MATPIATLLNARQPGYSLPAGCYTRQDVFEADFDLFFRRNWIHVALECEVPEPGDALTVDLGTSSVIVLRDDDNRIRVYHNVCRHRGARLLDPGSSIVSRLVCPYHQWTYELTGELVHAPHMGTDFDKTCRSLKPVNFLSVEGLIYICLSSEPPADVAEMVATMAPRLAPYDPRKAKVAYSCEVIEPGNWKLVIENNRECYHCASNHPELCLSFIDLDFGFDPASLNDEDRLRAEAHGAAYAVQSRAWEDAGHLSSAVLPRVDADTPFRTQRLIISGAGESQTPDTRAACRKLLGTMTDTTLGDTHLWGHNSWHHFMGDHAVVHSIVPLGPDATRVTIKWLVHKDAVEGVDYDLENLTSVWKATTAQDSALVARTQAGVSDPAFEPGPYSRFTEEELDRFATWYVRQLRQHGYGAGDPALVMAAAQSIGADPDVLAVTRVDESRDAVGAVDPEGATYTVRFARQDKTITVASGQTILAAAKAQNVLLPSSCAIGRCGTCKTRILSGSVIMAHDGGIRQREIDAGMILPCCSRPTSDIVLDR